MVEAAKHASVIWDMVDVVSLHAENILPFLLISATATWFAKTKSLTSISALIGTLFIFAANISHLSVNEVHSNLSPYSHPANDENILIWFFYLHGVNIGLLIVAISLVVYFFNVKTHIKSSGLNGEKNAPPG